MKKLFFSLVAAMMATATFAQGSLLATLSHDGNISAFYGANALKEAVTAAEAGDVITLSSGQFNAVNITKPITLRGAGMSVDTDSENAHEPTIVQNDFVISIEDEQSRRLLLEGLYFKNEIAYEGTIKNAQFLKCRFKKFNSYSNSGAKMMNSTFIHCRICDGFVMQENSNAYFINSLVCNPTSNFNSSNIEFDNCFVKFDYFNGNSGLANLVVNSIYKNCIIQIVGSANKISSSCTAYNCVGLGEGSMFDNLISTSMSNTFVSTISVFKNYKETSNDTYIQDVYNFELTDEAAAKYLGTDGKQVGIYGGNLPYDEDPTIPQITKCNVASKSTADGKLSVDIEVKAAEY